MITHAIFDVDGTILDTTQMWNSLPERYLAACGITVDGAALCERMRSMSLPEAGEFLRTEFGLPYSVDDILRQVSDMTRKFFAEEVELRAGIPSLLFELHKRGVRMSVATAGDRELILSAFSRLGIDGFFEGIATCSEYGSKNSPDVYLAAAEIVGGKPSQTLVFEDSLFAVRTAKAAGFFTAAVRDIGEDKQDDLRREADFYALSPEEYCGRVPELLGSDNQDCRA